MVEVLRVAPTPSLRRWASENGYSSELVARWAAFYPDVADLVAALEKPPRRFLRLNPIKGAPRETLADLRAKGFRIEPTPIADVHEVVEEPFSIGATEEYLLGRYTLQDLSSQLAVLAMEARPGERIMDLAAAPGGKTIALAASMRNEGAIHAFELDPERARGLMSNLRRCGVQNTAVHIRTGEDASRMGLEADRVLLDAPCTGEGVIQRDPRRKRGNLEEFAECARIQKGLMAAAVACLRPGGTLVYSTCTLAPEENELQVEEALATLPLRLERLPKGLESLRLEGRPLFGGLTEVGARKLPEELALTVHALPHLHGCLGFYLARFRKEASA